MWLCLEAVLYYIHPFPEIQFFNFLADRLLKIQCTSYKGLSCTALLTGLVECCKKFLKSE